MASEATKIPFVEGAAAATPAASRVVVYAKADGLMYSKDDAGAETLMSAGASGSVATDAIWDAAGDLAVGSGANTAAKLSIGAVGGALSRINGAVAWNSGTSNPGAAVAGDRYWRSDLGLEIYYDGTRWLTTMLLTKDISPTDGTEPLTGTFGGFRAVFPFTGLYGGLWVEQIFTSFFVNGGTALSGSHKWVGVFTIEPGTVALATATLDSGASSVWRSDMQTVAASKANTLVQIGCTWTKTGTPGDLFAVSQMSYRLIVT